MTQKKHIYTQELRKLVKKHMRNDVTNSTEITNSIFGRELNKKRWKNERQRIIRTALSIDKWGDLHTD